jgi:hypothetical protein
MHVNVMILLEVKIKYLASHFCYVALSLCSVIKLTVHVFSERMFCYVILPCNVQ